MGIKDRILLFISHIGISKSTFERSCGLSNGYVNNLKGSIGANKLEGILTAFPELNRNWLLTGEGEMLNSENAPAVTTATGRPYYDVDFIGGFDLVLNDQTITPAYKIDFAPYNKDGVIWCNITGRSMEPEIGSGDIIALKEVHDWQRYINYGEIYAIVTDNDLRTVKRVRKSSGTDTVLLVPTNPNYDIQEIEKSVISRIFSVLGCLKRF